MARLCVGEKERRAGRIERVLRRCRLGLTESDIAAETGLHRRTVNNYLRELLQTGRVVRDGRYWYSV